MYRIAGTGTRKIAKNAEHLEKVTQFIRNMLLERLKTTPEITVISGLAEGFDEALATAAYLAGVAYKAYIPNFGYGKYYWQDNSQSGKDRYSVFMSLFDNAQEVRYSASGIYTERDGVKMHSNLARNIDMVNAADELWVFDDGRNSRGTAHCVKHAKEKGLPMTFIRVDS